MPRLFIFLGRVVSHGSKWLAIAVAAILGIVGITYWKAALNWPFWVWLLIGAGAFTLLLLQGAFQAWDETDQKLALAEKEIERLKAEPKGPRMSNISVSESSSTAPGGIAVGFFSGTDVPFVPPP